MAAKTPPSKDDKPQRERFIEAAREAGASESADEFESAFRRITRAPEKNAKAHVIANPRRS